MLYSTDNLMNKRYNPERGIFIGKASKYLVSGALFLVCLMPTSIKADTNGPAMPVDSASATNASSIIAAVGMKGTQDLPVGGLNVKMVWITAYASVPQETSDHPFITASGQHVRDGIIASNWLPFGTQIEIPTIFGNKVFTVEDRMNQAFNQRVDIWMPTVNDAVDFGIQDAMVMILGSSTTSTTISS
jgi:3D (Asp-Asp-Asp) domain-containing protein